MDRSKKIRERIDLKKLDESLAIEFNRQQVYDGVHERIESGTETTQDLGGGAVKAYVDKANNIHFNRIVAPYVERRTGYEEINKTLASGKVKVVEDLKENISLLKEEQSELKSSLNEKLATIEMETSDIRKKVSNTNQDIRDINERRIASIEARVYAIERSITNIKEDIISRNNRLDSRLDTIESHISSDEKRFISIIDRLANLEMMIQSNGIVSNNPENVEVIRKKSPNGTKLALSGEDESGKKKQELNDNEFSNALLTRQVCVDKFLNTGCTKSDSEVHIYDILIAYNQMARKEGFPEIKSTKKFGTYLNGRLGEKIHHRDGDYYKVSIIPMN